MTFVTRSILAKRSRSAIVTLRLRQASRSASRATSKPILFLNLKESAMVLAGLVDETLVWLTISP